MEQNVEKVSHKDILKSEDLYQVLYHFPPHTPGAFAVLILNIIL